LEAIVSTIALSAAPFAPASARSTFGGSALNGSALNGSALNDSGIAESAAVDGPAVDGAAVRDRQKTRLRLTRRGRFVLTFLVTVPLIIGAALFALNGGGAFASADSSTRVSFEHVTVQPGQSLWQIAEKLAPTADPRDVIAAIVNLNQLPTSTVTPGQQLAVPSQYAR
jgi:hypothetical protein